MAATQAPRSGWTAGSSHGALCITTPGSPLCQGRTKQLGPRRPCPAAGETYTQPPKTAVPPGSLPARSRFLQVHRSNVHKKTRLPRLRLRKFGAGAQQSPRGLRAVGEEPALHRFTPPVVEARVPGTFPGAGSWRLSFTSATVFFFSLFCFFLLLFLLRSLEPWSLEGNLSQGQVAMPCSAQAA